MLRGSGRGGAVSPGPAGEALLGRRLLLRRGALLELHLTHIRARSSLVRNTPHVHHRTLASLAVVSFFSLHSINGNCLTSEKNKLKGLPMVRASVRLSEAAVMPS